MNQYRFSIEIDVEVEAPSRSDAEGLVLDTFGSEAMEDFGIRIVKSLVLQKV